MKIHTKLACIVMGLNVLAANHSISAELELSPFETIQGAVSMEFRFYGVNENGDVPTSTGRRFFMVSTPPNLEAIIDLFKKEPESLHPFKTGGAQIHACLLVLYDDFVGTKISSPPFIVSRAKDSKLYKEIIKICEKEEELYRPPPR